MTYSPHGYHVTRNGLRWERRGRAIARFILAFIKPDLIETGKRILALWLPAAKEAAILLLLAAIGFAFLIAPLIGNFAEASNALTV